MTGIDAAFHCLQPVAVLQALRRITPLHRYGGEFELRQSRLMLRWTHVGPQHSAPQHQRIGTQPDPRTKSTLLRFRRDLDALAGYIVFPAVIRATQTAFLVTSKPERDATVSAEFVEQAVTPLAVAEGNQPLRQQSDPH